MKKWRNRSVTVFVILWCLVFHYESVRHFYLKPFFGRWLPKVKLPKVKFLFPPIGWIMFFQVDEAYGHVQIFGVKDERVYEIDPHEVFRVRTIGYDNIHRGVINAAASRRNARAFCKQLSTRFKEYEDFRILYSYYPHFVTKPLERYQQVLYGCAE